MKNIFFAILFILGTIAMPYAQADDLNPQIANCEEITDPDTQTQVDFCTAHVGCKMVMGIQKACTKVKTFLNNLKNLTFGKSKIDSNDVFDAAAPSAEGDASFNTISKSIKSSYDKQPTKEIVSGKFENGVNWVYEGGMKDSVRNGTGVLITDTGTTFRGDFVEGRQAGLGELLNDKSRKAGVMANARMEGTGVERYADGKRYEGEYKADKQDGKGVMTWPDGKWFEGNYKEGLANGQGTLKFPDGAEYTGNFVNDKTNGQGTIKLASGDQYSGNWVDNKKQGQGIYKWANGNQYSGNWVDGKRHGQGTFKWADGTRFEGEWRNNGKFSGTETDPKGSTINYANGAVMNSVQSQTAAQKNSDDSDYSWIDTTVKILDAYNGARGRSSGNIGGNSENRTCGTASTGVCTGR